MENDRSEQIDLAKVYPDKVKLLSQKWENWAVRHELNHGLGTSLILNEKKNKPESVLIGRTTFRGRRP